MVDVRLKPGWIVSNDVMLVNRQPMVGVDVFLKPMWITATNPLLTANRYFPGSREPTPPPPPVGNLILRMAMGMGL